MSVAYPGESAEYRAARNRLLEQEIESDPGQDPRHLGVLEPLWNLLDLTPEGGPADWNEQLSDGT